MKRRLKSLITMASFSFFLVGCSKGVYYETLDYSTLLAQAKKEGSIVSLGMPDDWANWGATWSDLKLFYGLEHTDTDMNSAKIIAGFEQGQGDIGDAGLEYAKLAKEKSLLIGYILER